MQDRSWLDYQELAAEIYASIEPNADVRHDDRIMGHDSGIERQIDISLRSSVAGHDILVVVQARLLGRPADVNVVGEFASVVKDVRAAKGVLICSSGYTSTALEYGRNLNIDLCTAHDVRRREWALDIRLPILWVEYEGPVEIEMELVPDTVNDEEIRLFAGCQDWLTSTDSGLTTRKLGDRLAEAWNAAATPRSPEATYEFQLAVPGLRVRLGPSYWCPALSLCCRCTMKRKTWLGTVPLSECRGILNRGTGRLRARVKLSDSDVPLHRDMSWPQTQDVDQIWESSPMVICVEKRADAESFSFAWIDLSSE
jgi:hypothetical protein